MTKAIIFDCFGVLTVDHWREFVATLSPGDSETARSLIYEYDSGRVTTDELVVAIKKLANKSTYDVDKILYDKDAKNDELLSFIEELKDTYKIALLSNVGTNWVREEFLNQEEQNLFDEFVLSYEVGLAKPDLEIFELVLKRLGLNADECLLIDDSEGHCAAARKLGIKTIVYQNFTQMKKELEAILKA